MLIVICTIGIIISVLISAFTIWALIRLNRYIASLEIIIEDYIKITEELGDLVRSHGISNKNIIGKKNILDDE
jgi:hypothetical protein